MPRKTTSPPSRRVVSSSSSGGGGGTGPSAAAASEPRPSTRGARPRSAVTVSAPDSASERATSAGSPGNTSRFDDTHGSSTEVSGAMVGAGEAVVPTEEQLMATRNLQHITDQLSHSIVVLRGALKQAEQRGRAVMKQAVLPFQVRRSQKQKAEIDQEIAQTNRTIRRLLVMSKQVEQLQELRRQVFDETVSDLQAEIDALKAERAANEPAVQRGFQERMCILQRYWPWRQLLELGDTKVGATFEEELARGPRYRNVGIQNYIQSEYIEHQIRWLEAYVTREEVFRRYLRQLEGLVDNLYEINELMESCLTCTVCGLLFEVPVVFWPCGHTFCLQCFASLAIAPSLFRCPVCGSIGSEGYVHNLLIADTVAKWVFKDSGYGDMESPLNSIRMHMARFRKDRVDAKLQHLRDLLALHKAKEQQRNADEQTITISYRPY